MAPSAVPIEGYSATDVDTENLRPNKKLKISYRESSPAPSSLEEQLDKDSNEVPPHPLDVKPSGNALTATMNLKAAAGAFARLPDELIMQTLEWMEKEELVELGKTCKAMYAFTREEGLWKDLFVRSIPSGFSWRGTWRSTLLNLDPSTVSHISCRNLFSDVLYRPWQCVHINTHQYAKGIPRSNNINRLPDLTEEEYQANWTNKPFILTSPVKTWPVYQTWSIETLLKQYNNVDFRAEAVDWPLQTYTSYMKNQSDESPLYLFDRSFFEKMSLTEDSFSSPSCFGPDLFNLLGAHRPDNRWLIMGPGRSGSTFHKDPNATSAWNAVITGRKYWIMFPTPPPGIFLSEDQSEITSPLSIAEYLLSFHSIARSTPGCVEAIHEAGEVLHVPSGWYHLVLNLDDGIALTQNFVPKARLGDVLGFLRDKKDQISGFREEDVEKAYDLFVERLKVDYPELLDVALAELDKRGKKGKWEEITKGDNEDGSGGGGGFSFGFGGGDSDEEVP